MAQATGLPIMVYNNPVSYGVDITVDMFGELADLANIVAIKESSEDTRRLTDLRRAHGERFVLFAGVDDIVLESLMLGASGWVSGLTNAFPRESVALFALARAGRYAEALAIYRWFMPLLHLDTIPTLVQCIKLAEQLMGRGSEMVRAPRLCLEGEERAWVERLVREAVATRPRCIDEPGGASTARHAGRADGDLRRGAGSPSSAGAHAKPSPPRGLLHSLIGFVTNFFDTLGVGSFAPTTSVFKLLRLVPDERIPGTLNAGHALPTIAQALIFIAAVSVDPVTLVAMIGAAVLGAWSGSGVVARLPKRCHPDRHGGGAAVRGRLVRARHRRMDSRRR